MPAALSRKTLIVLAKEAVLAKPSFSITGTLKVEKLGPKVKLFKVKCSDCGEVVGRSLAWLRSSWGCMCTRGSKISSSQKQSVEDFSSRALLKKRKLKLLSEYKGLNARVTLECQRCLHIWSPIALNTQKGIGCPVCAPELRRKKCLKEYGVEHTFQRADVRKKCLKTMVRRYGVKYALQNKELFDKNRSSMEKLKPYKLGRKTVLIQGYEPQALDWILGNKEVRPSEIECGSNNPNIPEIPYYFRSRHRVYHPDIFIPKLNLIVEVKSSYTHRCGKEVNDAKRKACLNLGYKFIFLVMNKAGVRLSGN